MRLQSRQQLLDIWQAVAGSSYDVKTWRWGGREGRNSISDAEHLLCLMYPATVVESLGVDRPDETTEDVLRALAPLGDSVEIPKLLVRILTEYMLEYRDATGAPVFSGGSYFRAKGPDDEITPEQRALHVVDSYSMSTTLSLATIGFVKVFRGLSSRKEFQQEVGELEALASARLTAAMVGLLRSFTVNVFDPDSVPGRTLLSTVNQNGLPERVVIERLQAALQSVKAGLRDLSIGSGQVEIDLDNPNLLFECGWSWGVIEGAPPIPTEVNIGTPVPGRAQPRPYLYFTVVALDGIIDLTSERTRLLGLLNEEQLRLAAALQIRWDLTRSFWAMIASFGDGRWPLEDIPWRTSDEEESDYYSLMVTALVAQDLTRRSAGDVDFVDRLYRVLSELASRGRVTRRATVGDPAIALHRPGIPLNLVGSADIGAAQLCWVVSDFSVMLLKRVIGVAALTNSVELRGALLSLADRVWEHIASRRIDPDLQSFTGMLWDDPTRAFRGAPRMPRDLEASWYFTERVVESLVQVATLVDRPPLRSERLLDVAREMLSEGDQLFDRELFAGSQEAGPAIRTTMERVRTRLRRARSLVEDRPATAVALVQQVLLELEQLDAARRDATGAV